MSTKGSPAYEEQGGGGEAAGTNASLRSALGTAGLAGAALLLAPGVAAAGTITVNSNSGAAADDLCGATPGTCSLADAIQIANSVLAPGADQIVFASSVTGQIDLAADLPVITEDLGITGPGAATLALDGQGARGILEVDGTNALAIEGLELTGGFDHRRGAAIDSPSGPVTVKAARFTYNYVDGDTSIGTIAAGGAIHGSDVTVTDSTFIGNTASASDGEGRVALGGAIGSNFSGLPTLTIDGSTFDRNQAVGQTGMNEAHGGALGGSGDFKITNSTFSENMAIGGGATGGGIHARVADAVILNSTITEGSAADSGGGIFATSSAVSLSNSIVAGNTVGAGTGPDIRNTSIPIDATYSLIGSASGATITGTPNTVGVDPGLAPLADNGGPTQTRAITPASAAFDAGGATVAPTDQRGISRPQGESPDIGAFEVDLPPTANVTAARKQKVGGKVVKVKVKAGADESVTLVGKGKIKLKGKRKSFKLETVRKSVGAAQQKRLRLSPRRRKDNKRVFKLLRRGKNLRAAVTVKLSDATGNSVVERRTVRLKRRGR